MSSTKGSRRSWSLAARLTTWYTVASLVSAVVVMAVLYWGLATDLTRSEDVFLADKVHVLRAILRDRPKAVFALRREVELESAARREYAQVYVRLLDQSGRPHLATPGMDALLSPEVFTPVVPLGVEPRHGMGIRVDETGSFRGLAARAAVGGSGGESWVIQVAVDRGNHELLLASYRQALQGILAVTVVACPLVAYRIARRGLRPVHEISETARHIGSATLAARIESAGYPVELGALADTFNGMLDRLDESFRRLSQFSADIAHELRTPIHNMRGEAEVALSRTRSADEYKEALTSCLEESVRLSDLIGRLLFLARTESPGTHLEREEVHVARELAAVRDYYAEAAAEARVTLSVAAGDEVVSALDRRLLQRAIANLVSNSLGHTAPGGEITLTAVVDQEEDRVRIEVTDTGAGIPAQDLPRVFDRFYRADRSRSSQLGSTGLGLAIVKGIVTLHGGRTEIESEVGKGTRVALIIPNDIRRREHGAPNVTKT
jgi:two-component system heavy metal sensor histidine kinase CusS